MARTSHSHVEPGIAEDIVAAIGRALADLGFAIDGVPIAPVGAVVPGSAADALLDRAAEALGDPALGVHLGARIPIGSLGVLDYRLCASDTVRDALRAACSHYGIATQRVRLELDESAPTAELRCVRMPGITHSRHWIELSLALFTTRIGQALGRDHLELTAVSFQHAAPADRAGHDAVFGIPVEFAAARDRVAFPAALLDAPLRTASRTLAELLERRVRELEPAMAAEDPELDRIRRGIAKLLDAGTVGLPALADALGVHPRAIQRTLRARGTSHQQLVDELRLARARTLLDEGVRIAAVAAQLGYSDASAFFRSYRRWTGTSPLRTKRS